MDIFALFHCLCQVCSFTLLRQLSAIIAGVLCAPHTRTMREIARWSACRYRTVQRFFATPMPWASVHATFFTTHIHDPSHTYILAFDRAILALGRINAPTPTQRAANTGVGVVTYRFIFIKLHECSVPTRLLTCLSSEVNCDKINEDVWTLMYA